MNLAERYDKIVALIYALPPEQQAVALLGWDLRDTQARLEQAREVGRAGDQVMSGGIDVLRQPTWDELVERRGDHLPCSTRCGSCQRCRISQRWWSRHRQLFTAVNSSAVAS